MIYLFKRYERQEEKISKTKDNRTKALLLLQRREDAVVFGYCIAPKIRQ